jgi:hypothetical protein
VATNRTCRRRSVALVGLSIFFGALETYFCFLLSKRFLRAMEDLKISTKDTDASFEIFPNHCKDSKYSASKVEEVV